MSTVYISIGNSDDGLSQVEWAAYVKDVDAAVKMYSASRHGKWMSLPHSPWQNACWCVEVSEGATLFLRGALATLAAAYRQESIAWAVAETEFLKPA
jgi:hypothetical protein